MKVVIVTRTMVMALIALVMGLMVMLLMMMVMAMVAMVAIMVMFRDFGVAAGGGGGGGSGDDDDERGSDSELMQPLLVSMVKEMTMVVKKFIIGNIMRSLASHTHEAWSASLNRSRELRCSVHPAKKASASKCAYIEPR